MPKAYHFATGLRVRNGTQLPLAGKSLLMADLSGAEGTILDAVDPSL